MAAAEANDVSINGSFPIRAQSRFHEALVVGTGFGGLYALHLLKQQGLDVHAIDSGADVGGTWFWNRYPGARTDVESHAYRFSWDKEHLQTAQWEHNYLTQPELVKYFSDVANKHDLNRHIQFNTTLLAATWDDEQNVWTVRLSTGEEWNARYLVTAIGILHKKHTPQWPGIETFKGQIIHSSSWTPDTEHEGKRIAVIGSGASGVQLVSALAAKAATLTHFIRHAQYVIPAGYRKVTREQRAVINESYDRIWNDVWASAVGFGFPEPNRPALSVSAADRETIFQDLWTQGSGFRFLFGGFSDLAVDKEANNEAVKFIHAKIRETVKDPQKAAVLTSSDFFARRPLTDDEYYSRFNQPNVSAVDLKKTPIERITPDGIQTSDGSLHETDLIVLATGFNSSDGSYTAINFTGRQGVKLNEQWADGPRAHLGISTSGFPNLFFINGPLAPFANNVPVTEIGARFAAELIAEAEKRRKSPVNGILVDHDANNGAGVSNGNAGGVVESATEADEAWLQASKAIADQTLFAQTPSWFFGENIEGKKVSPRFYFGGLGRYRKAIADSVDGGYRGFVFGGK